MATIKLNNASLYFPSKVNATKTIRTYVLDCILRRNAKKTNQAASGLHDISIAINDGDRIGLLGVNGAGKSTFLRLLAGIYPPSKGDIDIDGKISTLFDLHLGMDDEATGYENIFIAGTVIGLTRKQILQSTDSIIAFSELGEAIHRPIKTYSSGMRLRLAFSIATSSHCNIMLIDEIVGVGDNKFLAKARDKIRSLSDEAKILVFASHAEFLLKDFCNIGLVFDAGRIVYSGSIDDAIEYYNNMGKDL